jgi:hypothetical protein
MARRMTPETRLQCAVHAVSELISWEWPATVPADAEWVPTVAQVAAKTRALYSWVEITPEEAQAPIDVVIRRRDLEFQARGAARLRREAVAS